jgi:hypothetical protein
MPRIFLHLCREKLSEDFRLRWGLTKNPSISEGLEKIRLRASGRTAAKPKQTIHGELL